MKAAAASVVVAWAVLAAPCGAQPTSATLYALSTETGMPHLEANLRYAVRQERRCLDPQDLSRAFWMLDDASLQDCRLVKAVQDTERAAYVLECSGGRGTSGSAEWQFEGEAGRLTGLLRVRLGGKNMTFFQRVTARPLGACPETR